MLGIVKSVFIIVMTTGVLASIAVVFFVMNVHRLMVIGNPKANKFIMIFQVFENGSSIMKLRLCILSICTIIIIFLYCLAGQKIADQVQFVNLYRSPSFFYYLQMEGIFDTLTQCSWYNWDAKNKRILLIFMANSLKSCPLAFAGYVADYQQAVSVSSCNKFAKNNLNILADNAHKFQLRSGCV
jgi:hypothetical protein